MLNRFKILAIIPVFLISSLLGNGLVGQEAPVRIGIIITDSTHQPAIDAALLAIQEANETGGYKGNPFQLAVRTAEGPWGVGSNRAVDLVYEEEVVAILGSLDGRNAHLVEQVATKSHILFLSAWATDPTLSQAYVPWYFRCIPNDDQQVEVLFKAIHTGGPRKVGLYAEEAYDARMAAKSFVKLSGLEGYESPLGSCHQPGLNPSTFINNMEEKKVKKVLVLGDRVQTSFIFEGLKKGSIQHEVYTNLRFLSGAGKELPDLIGFEGLTLPAPDLLSSDEGTKFTELFRDTYGYSAGLMAAYAYDGINLIIGAVLEAGPDPEGIRDFMVKLDVPEGVTGRIQFDELGNRRELPKLMKIKNGKPSFLSK